MDSQKGKISRKAAKIAKKNFIIFGSYLYVLRSLRLSAVLRGESSFYEAVRFEAERKYAYRIYGAYVFPDI
jgi:hypothetical protein